MLPRPLSAAYGLVACLAMTLGQTTMAIAESDEPAVRAGTAIAWHPIELDAEGFSALFPGQPEYQLETTQTILGSIEARQYVYETAEKFFSVERHQLPRLSRMLAPDSLILNRSKDGILSDREADEISFEETESGEHPMGVLRYRSRDGSAAIEMAQIHLVGRNIYLVTAESGASDAERSVVQHFFDSFQLLEDD